MDPIDDWQNLVRAQCGAITRRQALDHGLTIAGIRAHLDAGRWQQGPPGLFVTFSGPLPAETQRWVAVLACWPSALSHETAAEHWGMQRPRPAAPIHVTVAYGRSVARCSDQLVVHRSRAFEHIAGESSGPPVVAGSHTAVDLAVAAPSAREAMGTLQRTALAGKVSGHELLRAMDLRRPRRYERALRDAARLMIEGVMSALESAYTLDVERAHGLPAPSRQFPVLVDGQRLFEDLLYEMPDGEVIVRLDGWRFHSDRKVALRDRRRGNAAEHAGRGRLAFGWEEVTGTPCEVATEVGASLSRRSWAGTPHPCERCGLL
jgi:hypothetical protein